VALRTASYKRAGALIGYFSPAASNVRRGLATARGSPASADSYGSTGGQPAVYTAAEIPVLCDPAKLGAAAVRSLQATSLPDSSRRDSCTGRRLPLHAGSIGNPARLASTHGAATAPSWLHRISRQPPGLFNSIIAADPALMVAGTASAATSLPYANSFGGRPADTRAGCSDCAALEAAFLDSYAAGLLSARNPSRSGRQPALFAELHTDISRMGTAQANQHWGFGNLRGWRLGFCDSRSTAVWTARLASIGSSLMAAAAINADHSSRRFGHSRGNPLCPGLNPDPSSLADCGAFTETAPALLHRSIHSANGQPAVWLEGFASEYLALLAAGTAFTKAQTVLYFGNGNGCRLPALWPAELTVFNLALLAATSAAVPAPAEIRARTAGKQSALRSKGFFPFDSSRLADNGTDQATPANLHNRSGYHRRQSAVYTTGFSLANFALMDPARFHSSGLFAASFSGDRARTAGCHSAGNAEHSTDTSAAPLPVNATRTLGELRRDWDGRRSIWRDDLGRRNRNGRGISEHSLGALGKLRRDRDGCGSVWGDDLGRRLGFLRGFSIDATRTQRSLWLGECRHGEQSLRKHYMGTILKRFFYRPTTLENALIQKLLRNAEAFGPLHQVERFTVEGNFSTPRAGRPTVRSLFLAACPFHVAGEIPLFVVNALNRKTRRTWANMSVERGEVVAPLFAHSYPASTVVFESFNLGIKAPAFSIVPRSTLPRTSITSTSTVFHDEGNLA
jgi:hypothetical protein